MARRRTKNNDNNAPLDIATLAKEAEGVGFVSREIVVNHLIQMIAGSQNYLQYRQSTGRKGRYNETVARDALCIAKAVQLLEEGNIKECKSNS